jgi:16S rRNA (adenine1518-N6/adenine1519-N6)-dimethyltransferase
MKAKKSLGQNFLKSQQALRSIIEAGDIQSNDTVLEIGPGKGVLTEKLLAKAGTVIAVEKDDSLILFLQEKFKKEIEEERFVLIRGDILEFNLEFLKKNTKIRGYKIIANIPYYITGSFLQKFLETDTQPSRMVLMLQKEVAKRIVTQDETTGKQTGKESILSLSIKAFGTPKYIETVQAKYFSPAPSVDSAIILIKDISKNFFYDSNASQKISEEDFFKVVKAGFAHKRKVLAGNLREQYKDKNIPELFKSLHIPEKARAEDLSLEQWKKLILALS